MGNRKRGRGGRAAGSRGGASRVILFEIDRGEQFQHAGALLTRAERGNRATRSSGSNTSDSVPSRQGPSWCRGRGRRRAARGAAGRLVGDRDSGKAARGAACRARRWRRRRAGLRRHPRRDRASGRGAREASAPDCMLASVNQAANGRLLLLELDHAATANLSNSTALPLDGGTFGRRVPEVEARRQCDRE